MQMNIVNGYACRNCKDVSLAKRGVDPSRPQEDPLRPENAGRKRDEFGQLVKQDGPLGNINGITSASDSSGRGIGGSIDIRA
jgi:hypothetical protein